MSATPFLALELALERERLWPRLRIDGCKTRRTLDWFRLVDALSAEARGLIRARGAFRVFALEHAPDGGVRLEGGVVLEALRNRRLLQRADKVALCAGTLGGELEARSNSLARSADYPEATLLAMIGDCAVAEAQERLVQAAEEALEPEGLRRSVSLQPGAPYWGLEGNRLFAELLPLEDLGIRVLESLALSPSKSKTFACAFGRGRPGGPA